jgi:hypothetical protein
MQNNPSFISGINTLLDKLDQGTSLDTAVELANQVILLLSADTVTRPAETVFLDSTLDLPNAERFDHWFQAHPVFKSDR